MAWNGTGTYSRIHNWTADAAAGTDIEASRMDAEDESIAAGINACLAKNGENAATANLPMGGFKHTNVAASAARTDYLRVAELQDNSHLAIDAGGAADVQTLTLSPAITAYAKYQRFSFVPVADNTGACTLNVNGVGAKSIKRMDGSDPLAGDIDASGVAEVIYDGTNFVLLSAVAGPTFASGTITQSVTGGAVGTLTATHGLGTDDIDWGASGRHSGGFGSTILSNCSAIDANGGMQQIFGASVVAPAGLASSGTIDFKFQNGGATANCIVTWWARKR